MSSSNYCFLTWIQVSQEAGQVVWYSHFFQYFPQFIVIHTIKGFGIVSKAEIDVFLDLLLFRWFSGYWQFDLWFLCLFFFYFILIYNTVFFLPYINMSSPRVYMCSQSWTLLPPPALYYPSGSSQGTSHKHPVSCIEPGLTIHFI